MPSTATITAFYIFSANTKARASLVNANFDIFRGHLLPLSPSTQTAINNTYDLGSSEYRWRTGYFREIDIQSSTTTGQALQITGLTSGSESAFNFNIGSTTFAKISDAGIKNRPAAKYMNATTSAYAGGIGSVNIEKYWTWADVTSATWTSFVGSTITIQTTGSPVVIEFVGDGNYTAGSNSVISCSFMTSTSYFFDIRLLRGSTAIHKWSINVGPYGTFPKLFEIPSSSLKHVDFSVANTSASFNYSLDVRAVGSAAFPSQYGISSSKMIVYEKA